MDARSPPNDPPSTPWLSGSSRSSRAPLLSLLHSSIPCLYTAVCTYMLTYVLTGRNERPLSSRGVWVYVADAPRQEDRGEWLGLCADPRGLHDSRDGCSSLVQVL